MLFESCFLLWSETPGEWVVQYILEIKTADSKKDSIKALNEEDVSGKIYW